MYSPGRISSRAIVTGHILIVTLGVAILAVFPPSIGRMMLIPLRQDRTSAVLLAALDGGALIIASGPFRGSIIVVGDRARILRATGSLDVVAIAAPFGGCGAPARTA